MNDPIRLSRHDRLTGWALPAIAGITPFIVFFPLRPTDQQTYFLVLTMLLLSALLGFAWICGWRPLPGRPTAPAWLAIGLGLSAAISIVLSGYPVFSLKKALLPLCGFLFLGHVLDHPRRRMVLRRVTATLTAVAVVLSVYGILQFFGLEFLNYSERIEKNTVIATIGHPNFLGSVLGPMTFVLLASAGVARQGWPRRLVLAGVFLMLLCVAMARTRAVWLGMFVGFVVLLLLLLRYSVRHRLGPRMVTGLLRDMLIGGAALILITTILLPRIHAGYDLADRLLSPNEIKSRCYYWNAAIDLGHARPLLGIGFGMFDPRFWPYALEQQRSPMGPFYYDVLPAIAGRTPGHVHNEYLEVFVEQGFLGLTLLLAFLLFFLYFGGLAAMRCADRPLATRMLCYYAALVMTLVDAGFGFPWRLPVSLLVVMTILGWIYELVYPQPAAEPEPPRFS